MDSDLLISIAAVAAWTYGVYRIGRWIERRRPEPPTTRQLMYLTHLSDEAGVTMPPVRTRAEASTAIDDLLEEKRSREEQE